MTVDIAVAGDIARIQFRSFPLEDYPLFLKVKALPESSVEYDPWQDVYTVTTAARFAERLGLDIPAPSRIIGNLAPHLYDYQQFAVGLALKAKRFAAWLNTGLGKTPVLLEYGNQVHAMTAGRVLIVTPPAVIPQTIEMAGDFYGADSYLANMRHIESRDELIAWCNGRGDEPIAITNYEKFIRGEIKDLRHLAGLVLDESSILKTGGGRIKWNVIHSAEGIEYKLSNTATPAPNDAMEYASQAAFLETMRSEGDVLWTYYSKTKSGDWVIKPHARRAFYRFLASWSLYMHDPARFGFRNILAGLPDPVIHEERIEPTDDQRRRMQAIQVEYGADMFGGKLGIVPRTKLAQLARGFLYREKGKIVERYDSRKPRRIAEIVADELTQERQVLIWTTFDEEAPILLEAMRQYGIRWEGDQIAALDGKQPEAKRLDLLRRFKAGETRVLISKPQLIGYGLNLQFVRAMIFSGFDDSFERSYQAIRRAYRYGQTEPVHVYWPYIPELEGAMFDNIRQKEARFLGDVAAQEEEYRLSFIESGELRRAA